MHEATPVAAIVLKDLEKYYPPPRSGLRAFLQPFERATRPAFKGVTFEVQEGEAVALLGANGAGKSTILRILATLLIPTCGQAFVSGHDTAKDPSAVRRKLGYHAGSDQGFYPRLTGRQNLLFFGQLNHLTWVEAQNRIVELGDKFHLADALDRQVRTLSSGITQRLSLARALLHKPTVLLLDEPTRSLDAVAAAEFRRFLSTDVLRGAKTSLLFASHALLLFKRGNPAKWLLISLWGIAGGMLFPVTILPDWPQLVAKVNPMTHALNAMRAALLGGAGLAQLLPAIGLLLLFAIVLLPLSMLVFYWTLERTKATGTLSHR